MWHGWLAHLRQRRCSYVLLVMAWIAMMSRVFGVPVPWCPLMVNVTPSLPYTLALFDYWHGPYRRGDYVVYRFDGVVCKQFPVLRGQLLFKRVVGVGGDRISVRQRTVLVNGAEVGTALRLAPRGVALEPIAAGQIPDGSFYVQGTSPDSFDSRYRQSGLVRAEQIIGAVVPLF
ncbi:conjugative transfer signal peptidase TraF [Rugamonas aquatica]|uniref:Signal peptidase I n=1 Tax=Rugamonas aquatica TaxID=2743357 RepID=A0A6A7N6T6_9BURK|nr:conjugative transfer signal peptidase TraF [Rugamonas aquatica]MQA40592.1 conjugative transfer signal peptidase TraF [Rugamonas aquatica]